MTILSYLPYGSVIQDRRLDSWRGGARGTPARSLSL